MSPDDVSHSDTTEALAVTTMARHAHVIRGARVPAYQAPAMRFELDASCTPAFESFMRDWCARLDLARAPAETALVLRYHRMYGLRQLWHRGLRGVDFLGSRSDRLDIWVEVGYHLGVSVGELLLEMLDIDTYNTWFPWNNFSLLPGDDRSFVVRLESLTHYRSQDGRPLYAPRSAPTVLLQGQRRPLALTPHALTRLGERGGASHSYASLGDTFGLIDAIPHMTQAKLYPHQEAVVLYEHCAATFFSERYALEILERRTPGICYGFRLGYGPLVCDGPLAVVKTILPPGFAGTPEYGAVLAASFDPGIKEGMLARCAEQGYASLCANKDFRMLRWFHRHGVPQVVPLLPGHHCPQRQEEDDGL